MDTTNEKSAKGSGRKYASVSELMRGESISQEVQNKVSELETDTRITLFLARTRQSAGITQEKMAEHLGVGQSAISKMESGRDDDLTLREIRAYAQVTRQRFAMAVGKPPTHVEAVRTCALGIKTHLEALARIANQHEELEKEIEAFFGEACSTILGILAKCTNDLPNGNSGQEVRFELVKNESTSLKTPPSKTESPCTIV